MKKNYNYGECDICGAQMQERLISQDFWIKDELVVIRNVPAGVCPQCGSKVVNAETGRWLSALLRNPERLAHAPRLAVPMLQYSEDELAV